MSDIDGNGVPVERDGECWVVPDGGRLPCQCIRCGGDGAGKPRKFAFTWNPHGLTMGRSVTSVAAVATNRRGRIYAYYCARHRPKVLRTVLILLILAGAGVACCGFGMKTERDTLGIAGLASAATMLGLLMLYVAYPPIWLSCEKIEDGRLWIKPLNDKLLADPTA